MWVLCRNYAAVPISRAITAALWFPPPPHHHLSLSQSVAFRQSQPPPGHPPFSTTLRTSLFLFLWHTGHRDPRIIPPSFLVLSLFTAVQPRDAHVGRAGQDRPASEKARRAGPCSARSAVRMADSQWQIVSAGRGSAIGVAYVVAETENH